jgi:hypothetical protein
LGTRFGQDVGVAILSFRSLALWILGYPDAALADSHKALNLAREIGQAATLMSALTNTSLTLIPCGSYEMAMAQLDELVALANEKGTPYWKARGMILQGCLLAMTDKPLRRGQNDLLWPLRLSGNRRDSVGDLCFIVVLTGCLCATGSI